MKKVKYGLIFLSLCVVSLVIHQNRGIFFDNATMIFGFVELKQYKTDLFKPIYLYGFCFAAGFLISFFSGLAYKFKSKKQIKELTASLEEKNSQIGLMRDSFSGVSNGETVEAAPVSEETTKEETE